MDGSTTLSPKILINWGVLNKQEVAEATDFPPLTIG